MMKVVPGATTDDTVGALVQTVNFSDLILPFVPFGEDLIVAAGAAILTAGLAMDRSVFRELLPADDRWFVYAAGWINAGDGNIATAELVYQDDTTAVVSLGTVTHNANTWIKKAMGPFDVFATGGVPAGETIPMVRFRGAKNAGANGTFANWNLWLRLIPSKQ